VPGCLQETQGAGAIARAGPRQARVWWDDAAAAEIVGNPGNQVDEHLKALACCSSPCLLAELRWHGRLVLDGLMFVTLASHSRTLQNNRTHFPWLLDARLDVPTTQPTRSLLFLSPTLRKSDSQSSVDTATLVCATQSGLIVTLS
jgi:hypothetical protein